MNYYKRHVGDYAAKCGHLSPLEHGVYTLLLDAYYNREHAPTRAEALRWARARSDAEIAAVDVVLAEFFAQDGAVFKQKRVEDELAQFRQRQIINRVLGARGGSRKRIAKETVSEGEAEGLPIDKPSHKPLATSHKKEKSFLAARGTRLPENWQPGLELMQWTMTERGEIGANGITATLEDFRDYWRAKSGANATKLDWDATWRNWIRKGKRDNEKPDTSAAGRVTANVLRARAVRSFTGRAD